MTEAPVVRRLSEGGLIDRRRRLRFRWNGAWMSGYAGDTLASALLANGVSLVGRSIKYRRPRGILAAGAEEPCALVQLWPNDPARTEPNARAILVPLVEGLEAASVNVLPSVERDVGALAEGLSPMMGAGFYYKTMHGSRAAWQHVFEPLIRRAAGFGKAPTRPDPDHYDHRHVHCEVLVVGGGPAGLTAARAASGGGARVILADEGERLGGCLLRLRRAVDGLAGPDWVAGMERRLRATPEVRVLSRTTVAGRYDGNFMVAVERLTDHLAPVERPEGRPRLRLWHIRADRVILATGAHERPLVFGDNDRPGVMLAGAAQAYLHRWGVLAGERVVLFTNNDRAYEAAFDLRAAGATVAAIVDGREAPSPALYQAAKDAGIRLMTRTVVGGTDSARGRVTGARVHPLGADGLAAPHALEVVPCDLLLMSGGWSPVAHLACHAGGRLRYDPARVCFVPEHGDHGLVAVGGAAGTFALSCGLSEATAAGATAAQALGYGGGGAAPVPAVEEPEPHGIAPLWQVPCRVPLERQGFKCFVDYQTDATAADIRQAAREGFEGVEHMKRYTLAGFGTDQGKTANVNAIGILAETLGCGPAEIGTTTFRPPYTPVTFGALAGRDRGDLFDPARLTAIHDRHVALGAVFEDVGQWKRPWFYPRPGEDMTAAVARECRAAREGVAVLDASTLGKIDIQGPDAVAFLNRVYINAWHTLKVGRIRYGVMCREDGMVFDDGTCARLGDERFLMTTTTGNAAAVLDHLEEYLQTEWPDLRVRLTSVTEQWSTVSLAGPESWTLLSRLASGQDGLAPSAMPFMSWRNAVVAGLVARVFRISFTGELQYEITVPWHQGGALWDAVLRAGVDLDITPYGTETMHVLRAEKGFIIVGQETDGSQTPLDLGMDWLVSKKKPDFIGKRSLARSDTARPDRKQLVGLLPSDPRLAVPEGTQIVGRGSAHLRPPVRMLGFVTSSYWSPTLNRHFCLALVSSGRAQMGRAVGLALADGEYEATICDPVMVDKEGARRDGHATA